MYSLCHLLVKALSHIPFAVLYALSDALYYLLYYVIRYRRKLVRRNLTESFPEKSPQEIVRIEKRFYHFFMDMLLETCKLASISPEEMRRRVTFPNFEQANEVVREGRSVTFFIGHCGNWEWMSSVGLWIDEDAVLAQVYHRLTNPVMDALMKHLRERMGNVCVEMRETARFVSHRRSEGKPCMMALIADHSPKWRDIRHYVQFLHHEVPGLVGPEKMTKRYGHVPFFVHLRRLRRGYYECELTLLHKHPEELPDYELTDLYFKYLEAEILAQPECYLWTHNRFKYAR